MPSKFPLATLVALAFFLMLMFLNDQLLCLLCRLSDSNLKMTKPCAWKFVKYQSSPLEQKWASNVRLWQEQVCLYSNLQITAMNAWIAGSARNHQSPQVLSEDVFSVMHYLNNCTKEVVTEYLEPIAGLARDPRYCRNGDAYMVAKDYLVFPWNVSKMRANTGRNFYFDLGASTWSDGKGGASLAWFVDNWERLNVTWDGIYAFEATPQNLDVVWGQVPNQMKRVFYWYNFAVSEEAGDNPFEWIKELCKEDDYVLVKLDIDNGPLEARFAQQLRDDKQLLALIDDFYFEHHSNTAPMNAVWGTMDWTTKLEETYEIFLDLRNKGVKAHSWV